MENNNNKYYRNCDVVLKYVVITTLNVSHDLTPQSLQRNNSGSAHHTRPSCALT